VPGTSIETRGRDTYVSVINSRPLYQAVIAVSQKYGWVIDYEDPVYSAQESRDVTVPEWRRTHPNQRGALVPSGGIFVANLGEIDGQKPNEAEILQRLVDQYNQSANPGYFLGAHTVILQRMKQSSGLSTWLASLSARKRKQVATVAVANKMARMVWAVLCKGEAYRPPLVPQMDAA
jgi:hypothetical protein